MFSSSDSQVVREYAELKFSNVMFGIFEHSSKITIMFFRDRCTLRSSVFARGPLLGKGQEGTVYLSQDLYSKQCRFVAIKERICTTRGSKKDCISEYKILDHLGYGEGFFNYNSAYYLLMKYFSGVNVCSIPKDSSDTVKQLIASGMLRALDSVHNAGIFHGDIKPDNFVVRHSSSWLSVKLVDFGQSVFMSEATKLVTVAPAYLPPECRSLNPPIRTVQTEYYSLAMCQLEVLSKYSFEFHQYEKNYFDPYRHSDLIKVCSDVFLTEEELTALKEKDPWRYYIMSTAYSMYQENIESRPSQKTVISVLETLEQFESARIKIRQRSSSEFKYLAKLKKKALQTLDMSQVNSKEASSSNSASTPSPKDSTSSTRGE